ncbi:hypothetical protein [Yoonia tamlensis]|uniref:hypothetical protein n=1 Tax=Yoonia tamlensis TaxID=390270 RepID=UPI0010427030|nr:hypothetical protein [Yoonia tamlensis]
MLSAPLPSYSSVVCAIALVACVTPIYINAAHVAIARALVPMLELIIFELIQLFSQELPHFYFAITLMTGSQNLSETRSSVDWAWAISKAQLRTNFFNVVLGNHA